MENTNDLQATLEKDKQNLICAWEKFTKAILNAAEALNNYFEHANDTAIQDLLKRLMPTENSWIPCSERLPEKHQMVLTTIKGVDLYRECVDKNFFEALATAKKRTLVSVGYLGDDGWYGADGFPQIIPTVAWMPLPEPYKEAGYD